MTDSTAMGHAIREARLAKGMSLGQLASAVGRSSSSVRRWERGEVPPAIGIIDDLASVLDLDPDELRALRPSPVGDVADEVADEPAVLDVADLPVVTQGPEDVAVDDRKPPSFFTDVVDAFRSITRSWSGWIRGVLTGVVLLVMLVVLIWAVGELFDAFGRIWDSIGTGGT